LEPHALPISYSFTWSFKSYLARSTIYEAPRVLYSFLLPPVT
jgi:hypothetical protein